MNRATIAIVVVVVLAISWTFWQGTFPAPTETLIEGQAIDVDGSTVIRWDFHPEIPGPLVATLSAKHGGHATTALELTVDASRPLYLIIDDASLSAHLSQESPTGTPSPDSLRLAGTLYYQRSGFTSLMDWAEVPNIQDPYNLASHYYTDRQETLRLDGPPKTDADFESLEEHLKERAWEMIESAETPAHGFVLTVQLVD